MADLLRLRPGIEPWRFPGNSAEGLGRARTPLHAPARWMCYDVLPKNDNGKIDRPRLREGFRSAESRPMKAQVEAPSPADVSGTDHRVSVAQARN